MIPINTILDGVRTLLAQRFPGEEIYRNLVPERFRRPSWLVTFGKLEIEDAGASTVDIRLPIIITSFVTVDAYHNSHIEELARRMQACQEYFATGYLRIDDRALHVTGTAGDCNFDYAEITVLLHYQDNRPGGQEYPLMEAIHTTYKGE